MHIKKIAPSDFSQLSKLFIENNIDQITRTFTPFELSNESARWVACEKHLDQFFLGLINGKPVGFSMLRGWDEGFVIPSFGIFIDYRKHGLGLGRELLDLTIDVARNQSCSKIRLSVYASNTSAIKIYTSRGFQEINRSTFVHHGLADEKIIMMKDLAV